MSRQQLGNINTSPSASRAIPIQISRLRTRLRPAIRFPPPPPPPTLMPRPRRTSELLSIDMEEFEKIKWQKPDLYQKILGINDINF